MLCRRAQAGSQLQPTALESESSGKSSSRVILSVVSIAVAALAGFAAHAAGFLPGGAPVAVAVVEAGSDRPAPDRASLAKPVPAAQPPAPAAAALPQDEPQALAEPTAPQPALEPPPASNPAEQAARAAEDERRHQEVMAAIAARERERAASGVAITMYSTSWCGACNAARDHMREHGIAFTDRNVEEDPEAKAQQLQLNPRGSVPTIDVDGHEVLVGFSAGHLKAAIERSVARRTGS